MKDATPRSLKALHRRGTTYEVAATHPDGRSVVVGFTGRTSRTGLLNLLRSRANELVELTGSAEVEFGKVGGRWAVHSGAWTIGFTGYTERDVGAMNRAGEAR